MSKDHHKLDTVKESPQDSVHNRKTLDMSEIEKVFGTPNSPKSGVKHDQHSIANEKKHPRDPHATHNHPAHTKPHHEHHQDVAHPAHPAQPLLESPRDRQLPPLAGPEVDDLDSDTQPPAPYPGIDDGLLDPGDKPHEHDEGEHDEKEGREGSTEEGHVGEDGKWLWPSNGPDDPDYPYDLNGLTPRFGVDDRPISPIPSSIPDVNTYQQKKNLAQGMMDLALLSANANQMRYVLESASGHPYYYFSLTFIALSIIFQVAVGVGLILNSRYNVKDEKDICKADKINNLTVLGVFLITIVNVFITSFSVANTNPATSTTLAVQQAG